MAAARLVCCTPIFECYCIWRGFEVGSGDHKDKCYNEIRLCNQTLSTNHSRFTWTNLGGLWDHLRRSLQRERESSIWLLHLTSDDFESETWHNNLLYSSQFLTGWDTINIPKSSWVYYIQVWRGSYLRYVGLLMWSLILIETPILEWGYMTRFSLKNARQKICVTTMGLDYVLEMYQPL